MTNKNVLIIGIRDEESICHAIGEELKRAGYTIYATYQDEKTYPGVKRVAESLGIKRLFPYDARNEQDLINLRSAIEQEGLCIDLLVHGISYSTDKEAKLDMPLVEVKWEEFTDAIRIGAFSLVELSGALLPSLNPDASILSISMRWSKVAVPNFNVVCATKAGLESIIRGLAQSLGKAKSIRVNAISPGFVSTFSLGKIGNRLEILEQAKVKSPLATTVEKEDIASLAVCLLENKSITGMIYPIDAGADIMH